jgi:hypothetical protein
MDDTSGLLPSRDRILQHSLTHALIESGAAETAREILQDLREYGGRPAAMIALDQMVGGELRPDEVIPLLDAPVPDLSRTATWVASHHPEWGGQLVPYFRNRLYLRDSSGQTRAELKRQLVQLSSAAEIREFIASSLENESSSIKSDILLPAMAESHLKEWPPNWVSNVEACLAGNEVGVLGSAIETAKAFSQVRSNAPSFSDALLRIGKNESLPTDLRVEALAALSKGLVAIELELFNFLCTNVDPSKSVTTRHGAASVLAKAKLSEHQLLALADNVKNAGPLEVTKLLGAFEHSTNEAIGLKLFGAMKESKALASVRPDLLKTLAAKYPTSVQEKANELLALLNVDPAKQNAHLEELLGE